MTKVMTDKPPICLLCILLVTFLTSAVECAAAPPTVEYKVKAGFLFNFFNFVSWPAGQLPASDAPLKLCVIADGLAARTISEEIYDRRVLGRRLQVSRNVGITNLDSCQMVFISAARSGLQHKILTAIKGKSILSVGENRDFVAAGGVINFIKEDSRVRLQINQAAATQAHLQISSKLLRVAKTVITSNKEGEAK